MTILEVIKRAEKRQKTLSKNTAKVYIRRKGWKNLVDPVNLNWVFGEHNATPFKESDNRYVPNKENLLSNDWELFTHFYCTETENKDSKPKTVTISKENIAKSIEQIEIAKASLASLNKEVKCVEAVFEKTYGISFDCFRKNSNILIDKESRFLYLFAAITLGYSNAVNNCLNKINAELNNLNADKKTE